MCTSLGNDFEGAKILFGEFLGGTCGAEELCFNKSLLSDLKVGGRSASEVGGDLVALLCISNGELEFFV